MTSAHLPAFARQQSRDHWSRFTNYSIRLMATGDHQSATTRPFQFSLRQLLWAMTAICAASSSFYWLSSAPALIAIVLFVATGIWFFVASYPRFGYGELLATIALGGVVVF